MRFYLAASIAVTILAALTAKLVFFGASPSAADTRAVKASTINIPEMHVEHPSMDKLPVREVKESF